MKSKNTWKLWQIRIRRKYDPVFLRLRKVSRANQKEIVQFYLEDIDGIHFPFFLIFLSSLFLLILSVSFNCDADERSFSYEKDFCLQ